VAIWREGGGVYSGTCINLNIITYLILFVPNTTVVPSCALRYIFYTIIHRYLCYKKKVPASPSWQKPSLKINTFLYFAYLYNKFALFLPRMIDSSLFKCVVFISIVNIYLIVK
jgi:hypothetical protein